MTINTSPIGLEEAVESFTGYEEQKIEKQFGGSIAELLEHNPTIGLRAAAFIVILRALRGQDVKSPEIKAFDQAMQMSMKQANDFFPEDEEEPIPDEPVTPAGEGADSVD